MVMAFLPRPATPTTMNVCVPCNLARLPVVAYHHQRLVNLISLLLPPLRRPPNTTSAQKEGCLAGINLRNYSIGFYNRECEGAKKYKNYVNVIYGSPLSSLPPLLFT